MKNKYNKSNLKDNNKPKRNSSTKQNQKDENKKKEIIDNNENNLNKSNKDEQSNKLKNISKENTEIVKPLIEINKKLSQKEKAFYILANSPVLRLYERFIFSRSTQAIRELLPISKVLDKNEEILQNKIEELSQKIIQCNNEIKTPFFASKTADMGLNFITMHEEEEFRAIHDNLNTDKEKNLYYDYLRIIYLLFNEDYPKENNETVHKDLYNKIVYKKKFLTIRDYLYHIYIERKQENYILSNIDKINEILNKEPNFFKLHQNLKLCKFIAFSHFIIEEIIRYGNDVKNAVCLKEKAENFLDIVYDKLDMYRMKFKNEGKK